MWDHGAYQVTLTDCPDHIVALGTRADSLLTQVASTTEAASLLKDGVAECWTSWSESDKDLFLQQWIFQLYQERVFLDVKTSPDVHLEFSGLGGGQVLDNFVPDLLIQCVPSAPCYGASLAHLDVYNQNPKLRNTSSIGRTAQIHDYHILHVAAWPTGVCAWVHILCQFGLPSIKAAEANYIMTQACLAAAIGRKKPAHLREPHPGYVNFMKILMLCLHPVPLQHFAVRVLLPLQQSIIGRLLAMPDGAHFTAMRDCHIIGHSAGSYGGMVLSKVLTDVAFLQLVGTTRVTAVAMPASLLQVRYGSSRRVHLVHVCDDKLCVWRPQPSDMKELESRGIYVTYLAGSFHWLGKACRNYGHLNAVQLDYGPHEIKKLLDVPGFVPAYEKQRAPLRLMSWCTYSVPDNLRQTLYRLSTLCARHTTTPALLLAEANRIGLQAQNEDEVKQHLIRSLICHANGRELLNYHGVVGRFLRELPLAMVVYMPDYYLPQILPHDKGTAEDIGILAVPIRHDPAGMKFHYIRKDEEVHLYRFVNHGGYQFVMTQADVPKCSDPMEYIKRHYGKPLDTGRLVAIRFSTKDRPQEQFVIFALIMDTELRKKADWVKASSGASVKDKGFGNTLYKCNPKEFELAVLLESLVHIFAPKPLAAMRRQFNGLFLWPVSQAVLPEDIEVKDVFSLGATRSARELTAVAHTPASRMVRGLGIQTENPAATVMPPDTKGHLMGLLSLLLRRLLTPWHVPMDIPYDSWFRTIVLPIAAMEDGHLVAAISTVSLAIATGKLDLCIQGLFGAGKSRTAAILLSGLLALDKEERCHFQVICKENTGARSFANMLLYLEVPTDLRLRIGRFVADSEANKSGSGTYFDIFHSSKRERVQQCRLLLMTGGSCTGDRASPFSTLEAWQQKLVMVVIDEGQQYGGDREVASVAMLPPTCMVVWTGDAQQTPGGIAKGPSQIAITRRQLISRKHALRCPQDEYTPHTLFHALMKMVSHLDLPVVADLEAMFQLAINDLGPLWNPTEMSAHRECLDLLTRVCPDCTLRWDEPTADDVARMPNIDATIVGEEVNPTTLHLLAHICAALDSVPEWLQWVQAPDTLSTAGAAGDHSWGLMLPTSARTPGAPAQWR